MGPPPMITTGEVQVARFRWVFHRLMNDILRWKYGDFRVAEKSICKGMKLCFFFDDYCLFHSHTLNINMIITRMQGIDG